jgi:hypothetical protein
MIIIILLIFLNYLTERINKNLDEKFSNSEFKIEIKFTNNIINFTTNITKDINGNIYDPKIQFKGDAINYFTFHLFEMH